MWKCPECNDVIDYLTYSTDINGREWGSVNIIENGSTEEGTPIAHHGDDYDCSDTENGDWSGEMIYECPNCNNELDADQLIWTDDLIEEEKTEKEIEKQNLPVFFDSEGNPEAVLMYINRNRVIYLLKPASEEEVIALFNNTNDIHFNGKKENDNEED